MKVSKIGFFLVLMATVVLLGAENGYNLFQKGLAKERVEVDLKSAVRIYEQVVRENLKDHKLAAQALFRIGECKRALGDAEASKAYERIVREFADQPETVAQAQARLGGSAGNAGTKGDRAVWTGSKVDLFGRVSPDGRFISYWDRSDGRLMLHDIASNVDRALTPAAPNYSQWAEWSAISKDGKWIAYDWLAGKGRTEFRMAALQGNGFLEPRKLNTDYFSPFDWSPDGKWIATIRRRQDRSVAEIGLIAVLDGSFRSLKSADGRVFATASNRTSIRFSPDGKYIAYDGPSSDANPERDVFVLPIDGGREIPAIVHDGNDTVMGWSPDGMWLLFSSDRTGSVGLWGLPFADGKVQGPPELLKPDIGPSFPLGVTASGALYVFKSINSRDTVIAPIDLVAGKLLGPPVSLTQGFVNGARMDVQSWSPDGNYLAYSAPCHGRQCVAIRSVATGKFNLLTGIVSVFGPRWSPDGRLVLTRGVDEKQRNGWFQFDMQTGVVMPLTFFQNGERGEQVHWSPEGKIKVYFNRSGVFVERDVASGAEREVNRVAGSVGVGGLSPDGRYFAPMLLDPATKTAKLLLVPVDGGQPRDLLRLTRPEVVVNCCVWTPDSSAVLLVKDTGARRELWLTPVDEGRPRKLDIDPDLWMNGSPDPEKEAFGLSPDGRSIAFQMGKTVSEVWALENFLPAPKPRK
jgi:Tol biopolymer transport system component